MILKVLQWNCMYSEDVEAIAHFLKQTEADIIFLQELTNGLHPNNSDTGAYIAKVLDYDGHFAYGPMVLPGSVPAQVGMGIFSNLAISNKQKLILQDGKQQDGKIIADERFCLQAAIRVGNKTIGLGTTHLPFHPTFRTTTSKQQMVESISDYTAGYKDYILGADLNTTPYTNAAVTLRRRGFTNAGPALRHPTWTTKPFTIGSWSYRELRWRLDYILTKGSIKPKASGVLATQLSDHLPIISEFEIEK